MINTNIDQLLKSFVPRPEGGPASAGGPYPIGPPFDSHLRRLGQPEPFRPTNLAPLSRAASQHDSDRRPSADVDRPPQNADVRQSSEANRHERDDTTESPPTKEPSAEADTTHAADPLRSDETRPNASDHGEQPEPPVAEAELPLDVHGNSDADSDEGSDNSPNAEGDGVSPGSAVVQTVDHATAAADETDFDTANRPAVAKSQPPIAQAAGGSEEAGETGDAAPPKPLDEPRDTPGETKVAAPETFAADSDSYEPAGGADSTETHPARPQRQTKSLENDGKQQSLPKAEPSVPTGEQTAADAADVGTAVAVDESERDAATEKSSRRVAKSDRHEEKPAESQPQTGRTRATAAPRAAEVPQVAAAIANAMLAEVTAALPADTASESATNKTTTEAKESLLTTFTRFDRHAQLGARGIHRGDGPEQPQIDPARFISRVARAIHTAHERGGPLQLRLSPPELGSLRLELSIKQGVLTANVETETPAAKQALLDNLPALRDRLAEQNVRIERFDVDVRRDGGGEQPQFGPQQGDERESRHTAPSNRTANHRGPGGGEIAETEPARRAITDTSINVIA